MVHMRFGRDDHRVLDGAAETRKRRDAATINADRAVPVLLVVLVDHLQVLEHQMAPESHDFEDVRGLRRLPFL